MHARLTPGLLGLTAFLFYYTSIPNPESPSGEQLLLSLLIGIASFTVYHQAINFTRSPLHLPTVNRTCIFLFFPVLVILFIVPFIQCKDNLQTLTPLTLSALFTAAYYQPLRVGHRIINGLRAIPLVKNVTIGLAWGLATTPILSVTGETIDLFWFRFLFILALSIAIDVRDCATDSVQDTRTLAVLIGSRNSNTLASILLLFAAGFAWLRLSPSDATSLQATIIPLHTIITAISVSLLNANSKPMTYFWLIDFQLFLHALLFLTTRIGN